MWHFNLFSNGVVMRLLWFSLSVFWYGVGARMPFEAGFFCERRGHWDAGGFQDLRELGDMSARKEKKNESCNGVYSAQNG